jgi:DNA-binding NtrC family response regulator
MRHTDKTEFRVLVACADVAYGQTLDGFLKRPGRTIERCHDAPGLLRLSSRRAYEVMVLDLALDEQSPMDIVSFVLQKNPATRLILLFDPERMERALEGIRLGAFFYLPRSCAPSDVALVVDKAVQNRSAQTTVDAYEQTVFEELVGRTEAMQRVVDLIRKVAPTDSTVLLLGESGTGKEVVAHTLHRISRRKDRPFVAVNCAALPDALLESELFGHVRGAFTGADRDNPGLFTEADGGTIFLDEIGDMSLMTQAKLLRVLQNGEVRPVGANTARRVDVRVIAATNRDLLEATQRHEFREDLYFRLNVVQIRIPPLRERMDALPALVSHFIAQHNARFGKNVRGMDEASAQYLRQYAYPGNVRELESVIAHAIIMADTDMIRAQDLPDAVRHGAVRRLALGHDPDGNIMPLAASEERHIRDTLKALHGNQSLAAKKLGISRSTLWRKMKEYQIEP